MKLYSRRRLFFVSANGEDIKTVQELLRHANGRITLNIYTQAVTPATRARQTKVVEMIVPKSKEQKELEETVGKARISVSKPSELTPSRSAFVSA